jgi:hypothetical protein
VAVEDSREADHWACGRQTDNIKSTKLCRWFTVGQVTYE